jgi:hypothetical protein
MILVRASLPYHYHYRARYCKRSLYMRVRLVGPFRPFGRSVPACSGTTSVTMPLIEVNPTCPRVRGGLARLRSVWFETWSDCTLPIETPRCIVHGRLVIGCVSHSSTPTHFLSLVTIHETQENPRLYSTLDELRAICHGFDTQCLRPV